MTKQIFARLILLVLIFSCKNNANQDNNKSDVLANYANDVIPFFQDWNLILGDGSNAGQAINFENKDFFFTTNDDKNNWVVFKTPNAGKYTWYF